MNNPTAAWSPAQAQALEYAWGEYLVWAATSRQKKKEIFSWKFRVLVLTVLGAFLGTVSSKLSGSSEWAVWITAILGGTLVALATYLGRELLSPDQERHWIRSRSLAEALKAETFLFRTGAPPYDGPEPAPKLMARVKELLATAAEVHSVTLSPEDQRQGLPAGPLSVAAYIKERLDDQLDFYRPRVQQYDRLMKIWRNVNLALGAVATVLGVLGKWTGAWVAVITTITTSVAAYLYANRYQYLIISFQATVRQLDFLRHQWGVMGAPEQDPDSRSRFFLDCEEAISIENSAWMAKWTEKPSPPATG
jgi:hypothetical protein